MKEEKLTSEEKLNIQLRNFTIEEIESYLELLLTKAIESVEKEDLATYGSIEKTLNSSLIIFSSKVRNFHIIYNRIKLKVANKFLKKYLNSNITILDEVGTAGAFLTVEEAEKITAAEDYKRYLKAKAIAETNVNPSDIYINDRYSYISNERQLIDKETKYTIYIEGLVENTEIFKAFITKDSAILTDIEKDLLTKEPSIVAIVHEEEKLKAKEKRPYSSTYVDEEAVTYYNENEVFLVYLEYELLHIYHKRTGTQAIIEVYDNQWFYIDFANYCLGKVGTIVKELEEA